jgi:hypothetical protein
MEDSVPYFQAFKSDQKPGMPGIALFTVQHKAMSEL